MRARAALIALCALLTVAPARAHLGSHEVQVRNSYYTPQELRIDAGETVTWNVIDGGHTITADDGRFDFFPDRTVQRGDSVAWTFTADETVYYHCKVHTAAMFGVIVVGTGSPPPSPGGSPDVRAVPTAAFPSIGAAVGDAAPGTVVELSPGIYHESVRITLPGVTLRGMGDTADAVRIEGASSRGIGIAVQADDTTIENLSVRRHVFAGIYALDVDDLRVERVALEDNDRFGLRAQGVRGLSVAGSAATGADTAGFSIDACDPCDAVISGSLAEGNMTGVSISNAAGVVLRSSTVRHNGTGIALKSVATRGGFPQRGAQVYGNLIKDNVNREVNRPPSSEALDIPTGVGVWLSGGNQDHITSNTISGHLYNVAVTGLTGPSSDVAVTENTLAGALAADLAWDGLGAGVCFGGNGAQASSEPPLAQTLYACGLPVTAGAPFPLVDARILTFAP